MKETTENENQEMEQDFVLWGEREKKGKISVLIGLSTCIKYIQIYIKYLTYVWEYNKSMTVYILLSLLGNSMQVGYPIVQMLRRQE